MILKIYPRLGHDGNNYLVLYPPSYPCQDQGDGDVAPHGPDPGCPRINAMIHEKGTVKIREILRKHREGKLNELPVPGAGSKEIPVSSKGKKANQKNKQTKDRYEFSALVIFFGGEGGDFKKNCSTPPESIRDWK